MLKTVSFVLVASCLLLGSLLAPAYASGPEPDEPEPTVPAQADAILGHWQRGEGEAIIEVRRRAGGYHGVIVWSERRPEIVGEEVFRDLRYKSQEQVWEGRAYSIKRKREVQIDIELPKHDQLELRAHILFFTRTVDFRRIRSSELAARRRDRGT